MGFFPKKELDKAAPVGCGRCGLHRGCKHPRMEASGGGSKKLLIIAESPSKEEDEKGVPLTGKGGQLLAETIYGLGWDMDHDCRKINAVSCRVPRKGGPTGDEIQACRPMVMREIRSYKPTSILLLGNAAVESYWGDRYHDDAGPASLTRTRGFLIPDYENKCWVGSTFHPNYVLRMEFDRVVKLVFAQDVAKSLAYGTQTLPVRLDPDKCVRVLHKTSEALAALRKIRQKRPLVAFDYETTGLKPHADGHRVKSIAVAVSDTVSYSFLFDEALRKDWVAILRDKRIKKVAHNLFMEDSWSRVFFGTETKGWFADTRLIAHMLDNRQSITPLKFLAWLIFGLDNYGEEMRKYLEPSNTRKARDGDNAFNTIDEAPIHKLLFYGGIDALITRRMLSLWKSRGLICTG